MQAPIGFHFRRTGDTGMCERPPVLFQNVPTHPAPCLAPHRPDTHEESPLIASAIPPTGKDHSQRVLELRVRAPLADEVAHGLEFRVHLGHSAVLLVPTDVPLVIDRVRQLVPEGVVEPVVRGTRLGVRADEDGLGCWVKETQDARAEGDWVSVRHNDMQWVRVPLDPGALRYGINDGLDPLGLPRWFVPGTQAHGERAGSEGLAVKW